LCGSRVRRRVGWRRGRGDPCAPSRAGCPAAYSRGMHGVGDHLSTGERIALYRARRGMAQSVLAGLVGRSEDWLSKIERGERE
jgi:hypothetical protein